jgi:hypothetical protein
MYELMELCCMYMLTLLSLSDTDASAAVMVTDWADYKELDLSEVIKIMEKPPYRKLLHAALHDAHRAWRLHILFAFHTWGTNCIIFLWFYLYNNRLSACCARTMFELSDTPCLQYSTAAVSGMFLRLQLWASNFTR